MYKPTKKDELKYMASQNHLDIDTYSPKDGITRYRFWRTKNFFEKQPEYFANSHQALYTALGIKEAKLFIFAYGEGFRNGYNH